jgi:hypothetical protein
MKNQHQFVLKVGRYFFPNMSCLIWPDSSTTTPYRYLLLETVTDQIPVVGPPDEGQRGQCDE